MHLLLSVHASMYNYLTLRRRITFIFLISVLIPFVTIGLISYYTIYSILTNKIQAGIQSNLKQVRMSLESTIGNLNHVSQQMAFEGTAGKKLEELLEAQLPYDRYGLTDELKEQLRVITFTNPSIGLTFYYFQRDHSFLFENLGVRNSFDPSKLPLLAQYSEISYYGPHISNSSFDNQYVLSALRKVELPSRDDVYVYIESAFHLTQNILDNDLFIDGLSHIFLDNDGRIAYTESPDMFPMNRYVPEFVSGGSSGTLQDHYWFKDVSNQGWSMITIIPQAKYNKEMNQWFVQILFFSLIFLGISLLLAWLLWKMVYRPLSDFNKEIKQMSQAGVPSEPVRTQIPEFDHLLHQYRHMKEQIWQLFSEVEQKERRRIDLEVEKLLYQINPHFLMNSLDTVHWLAVMNGQTEIDRLVLSLNKLLYYNLGKLGQTATMQEEIDALQQYLILQQIRYDFQFDVRIHVDEEVLKAPVPRFILQPLVENSLYHGLNDDGYIQVEVKLVSNRMEICIRDNGSGMTKETIHRLLNEKEADNRKVGMGIGMNYVKRMLETQYGEAASLVIESTVGQGTSVYLTIPVIKEREIA
jgi:two-component system, sensor histidine kinase YesM